MKVPLIDQSFVLQDVLDHSTLKAYWMSLFNQINQDPLRNTGQASDWSFNQRNSGNTQAQAQAQAGSQQQSSSQQYNKNVGSGGVCTNANCDHKNCGLMGYPSQACDQQNNA
ncbi:hypothetical protein BGW41_006180 [Actinomortierella wolfii]|nr:hypothetical protein BGW41_006180 [Actinomortierella wolfii]